MKLVDVEKVRKEVERIIDSIDPQPQTIGISDVNAIKYLKHIFSFLDTISEEEPSNNLEKVRTEIVRLYKEFDSLYYQGTPYAGGYKDALYKIKQFLDNLPKIEQENLEKEIEKYFKIDNCYSIKLKDIARHFYNLGQYSFAKGSPKDTFNEGYKLGHREAREEFEDCPKIKGWVARNRPNVSPSLIFFKDKPVKRDNGWGDEFWANPNTWSERISISADFFPEITWESEPVEVELTITKL